MDLTEKESTESGSPMETESMSFPLPVSSGETVAPVSVAVSMTTESGHGGGGGDPVSVAAAAVPGMGPVPETVAKKKRGRPRKYDAEGNLRVPYVAAGARSPPPPGFTLTSPNSSGHSFSQHSSSTKRGRGRPAGSSSGSWQVLASLGEIFASTAGGDFTPHVVNVYAGEDVAGKIFNWNQKGSRGICVLSANGTISNVTIRQPGSSGGLLTYEGRFEILSLTGSITLTENGGNMNRTGGLSVSLAGPDGRVIGGGVAGSLLAASPIQIVLGSFVPSAYKTSKRRPISEPQMGSVVHSGARDAVPVMEANPISQAAPENHVFPNTTPHSEARVFPNPTPHFEANGDAAAAMDNANSMISEAAADYNNGLGPTRIAPDINVCVSFDQQ